MLIEGSADEGDRWLRASGERYYVYVLQRPDRVPFYVGKGSGRRVFEHEAEARRHHPFGESNPFKCNVIRKIIREGGQVRYAISAAFPRAHEMACLRHEAELIARHGRLHEGGY